LVGNGWRLTLQPGAFGRRGGIWPELATNPYVSGNHGVIGQTAGGWTITDSGSTNGTYVNDKRLEPGVAVELKIGDRVRIATLEFTVE
jgi:pSer/pThr/pTyr-binding forkhead associated (FHA) protein